MTRFGEKFSLASSVRLWQCLKGHLNKNLANFVHTDFGKSKAFGQIFVVVHGQCDHLFGVKKLPECLQKLPN